MFLHVHLVPSICSPSVTNMPPLCPPLPPYATLYHPMPPYAIPCHLPFTIPLCHPYATPMPPYATLCHPPMPSLCHLNTFCHFTCLLEIYHSCLGCKFFGIDVCSGNNRFLDPAAVFTASFLAVQDCSGNDRFCFSCRIVAVTTASAFLAAL